MVTRSGGILILAAPGAWLLAGTLLQGWSIGGFGASAAGPTLALLLIGAGALLIASGRREPFVGRLIRVGLALLGVGGLALFGASMRAGMLAFDPLEDSLAVGLLLAGLVLTVLGLFGTGLAMFRRRGRDGVIGSLLLGGVLADLLTSVVSADLALGGFVLLLLGLGGIGLVAAIPPRLAATPVSMEPPTP